ncbi:isopeptide-forming domain-containing fimbrial protein [Collinsella sp. AF28-5AC]|uniref:isopeptide-forming domain-containing fimbrial protein n=2 Tax=unclassified Collinsella TaxID=2637548 RepID=UPI001313E464|nr:isopeptide-forming domain-containing fimbrial protein [Collinsella sp. AF28-5AC]
MSKNIARLAVTAGLTAALSFGGVMAPVTMAFAEGVANGSVTITNANGNETNFKGYKIFDANVVKDENDQTLVSNITWANDKVETAVTEEIKKIDPNASITTAQDAADWIKTYVTDTNETTSVESGSAAYKIAAAVAAVTGLEGSSGYATTSKGAANNLSHGYWLFVTDAATVTGVEAGTAPIFTVVGDEAINITEKTSIPTVDKEVFEGGNWGKVSDSYIGEKVEYKLTGSVASNIDTFTKYEYTFQDHLSVGLEADKNSVKVTINDTVIQPTKVDLAETVNASGDPTGGHDLSISFTDLKAAAKDAGVTLKGDSKVVVTYKAKLTEKAEYTAAGNTNDVKLVYSNNPMVDGTGTSTSKRVTDHVFRLDVTKVDKDDQSHKLEATFQVKMTHEGNKKLTQEKWLTQEGGLTEEVANAGKFKTDKDGGKIYIPGLVAGTYEITECDTPAGYNTLAPFTITVDPEYNDDGTLKNLDVTSSNTEMVASSPTNDATIPVTIQNKKGSGLPLTGLNGVTFTWIAGGAVLCIGVAHLIRSRKQAEESEQE